MEERRDSFRFTEVERGVEDVQRTLISRLDSQLLTRNAFWEPQRLAGGTINPQSYAIGWRSNLNTALLGQDQPVWNVHHGGVSKGAYSWMCVYPELKIVVALNANARLDDFATFMAIEQDITRVFLKAGRAASQVDRSVGLPASKAG